MTDIQSQCWICPQCFDDRHHKPGDMYCLREQIKGHEYANSDLRQELTAARDEAERLRADAERFRFLARREAHDSMKMVEYEIACISGESPTEDDYRSAVDAAMVSAQRLRQQADDIENV